MTKTCIDCKRELPLDEFYAEPRARDGRRAECRTCRADRRQLLPIDQRNAYNHRRKLKLGRALIDYLEGNPCVDCGCTDWRVLEFDHRNDVEKTANISAMINTGRRWDAILAEIAKCVVRCRNCHMIRTHAANNSWRHQLWTERATERSEGASPLASLAGERFAMP